MPKTATSFKKGNNAAERGHRWRDALDRALSKRSKRDRVIALDELAERFLQACDEGDVGAFKELGNRLDGLPTQAVDLNANMNVSVSMLDVIAAANKRAGNVGNA